MKFLMLIKHAEDMRVEEVPKGLMDAMGTLVSEGLKSGAIIDTAGLKPTKDGFRVRLDRRQLVVTDGPFTESKELIAGFYLIEVKSKEDAIAWAARCPVGHGGDEILDLYQMTELSDLPPRLQEIIGKVAPTWSSKLWRSI